MTITINSIIEKHGLKRGDAMKNVSGNYLDRSRVIDNYTFVTWREDAVRFLTENPITGERRDFTISKEAFETLQQINLTENA